MNYDEAQNQIFWMSVLLVLIIVCACVALFFWQRWLNKKMTNLGLSVHKKLKQQSKKR